MSSLRRFVVTLSFIFVQGTRVLCGPVKVKSEVNSGDLPLNIYNLLNKHGVTRAKHVVVEAFALSGRGDMEGFVADVFLEQSFVVFAPVHL